VGPKVHTLKLLVRDQHCPLSETYRRIIMNEEEKQAIETVKQYKKCFVFETVHEESGERLNDYSNAIEIVLSLIEKQQQEIEDMREELQMYVDIEENFDTVYMKAVADFKGKIRAKIEELEELKEQYFEKQIIQGRIDLLKELLKE